MTGFYSNETIELNDIEIARRKRKANGEPLIDLTSTNPTYNGFIFPKEILEEQSKLYFSSRRYRADSKGLSLAREAISEYYLKRSPAIDIPPEHIFITASTSEAYSLLFSILCEPGDNLLQPDVTYPLFDMFAAHHRVFLNSYKLIESQDWQIDSDSISAAADQHTRAVLIVSPHNPTGMIVKERIEALSKLGLPIICDEVFAEFTVRASHTPPMGALHPELPVFHLNGISKMFALPDMKLGWIAMNDMAYKRYGERLEILNDAFLNSNSLTQAILPALFAQGFDFVKEMRATIQANVQKTVEALSKTHALSISAPEAGWSLFPRVIDTSIFGKNCNEEAFVINLIEKGVLVHPGYFYGTDSLQDGSPNPHIMLSCLTQEPTLSQGLELLQKALSNGRIEM